MIYWCLLHVVATTGDTAVSEPRFLVWIDAVFTALVQLMEGFFFFEIGGIPLILLWLLGAGMFFTLRYRFINLRGFKHAIDILQGKYDDPEEPGDVSHFQAVATALSGSVGLGNIAGAAIGIQLGGPGAIVWMSIAGMLGMSSKFIECTLAQKFRLTHEDGTVAGGPMYYLQLGLASIGRDRLGRLLAVLFAFFCVGGAFGAGNAFQANQSYAAVAHVIPWLATRSWLYGLIVAAIVGLVIVGGIGRIGRVTSSLVPAMVVVYFIGCLWTIGAHLEAVPQAIARIIVDAFTPSALGGGILASFLYGFRRGAFSNAGGFGSAAIAHAATRNQEPIREGIVASIEPFIDTVVICNLTALTVVISGVTAANYPLEATGVEITATAFATAVGWFPNLLAIAVFLFAFSTMISWSYYGEQAWCYLWGENSLSLYKGLYLAFIFIGSVVDLGVVLDFGEMMMLGMAFPNLIGCFLLSGQVGADLKLYLANLQFERLLALPSGDRSPEQEQMLSSASLSARE